MKLSYYLLLSKYIPLPLSGLKLIQKVNNHPLRSVENLSLKEIEAELELLNNQSGINIRNIKEKAQKTQNLIQNDFLEKLNESVKRWNDQGITILSYFDKEYPIRLKGLKNAPKFISFIGNFQFSYETSISIIGTRHPTDYGLKMAYEIGKRFAELGFIVINGFAKGIDTQAIKGALVGDNMIIGILGSGLLNPYPKENVKLFNEIIENERGIFISEQLPEESITKSNLAARNRISSALSLGNVIIEAGEGSGTTYQLDYGKKQGKPTVVLKPKENTEQSYLPNYIIEKDKNCFIIETVSDIDHIASSILKIERGKKEKNRKININRQKSIIDF